MNLDDYRITYNLADWERIALRNGEICAPIGAVRAVNALCGEVERLLKRVATLEDALTALVVAKDEKEFHGDTAVYQSLKKTAWNKARAAIRNSNDA